MRPIKFLLPLLILAIGFGGFHYFKKTPVNPTPLKSIDRLPVVSVQEVTIASLSPSLTLFGEIEAPNISILTSAVSADVLEVNVLEGTAVQKWDRLIRLDDEDTVLAILQRKAEVVENQAQLESDQNLYQSDVAALDREKALLALSQKSVERARALARTSAGSEATLDSALKQEQQQLLAITQRQLSIDDFDSRQRLWRARIEKSEAALKSALNDQSRTNVLAPYSGRVTEVMVSQGDRVIPGAQLVQLYDDTQLEIRTQIPSRHLFALQSVFDHSKVLDATMVNHGKLIKLRLNRLSAKVDQGQGGVDAFFRSVEGQLPALGTTVEINLDLPAIENTVALSINAAYSANRVYKVVEGVLQAVTVQRFGQRIDGDGNALIIIEGSPFSSGDLVLSSRLPQAIDGLKVEISSAK
jgi:multidrug efflux pump subunit AcrA (membrane-fusion protein)